MPCQGHFSIVRVYLECLPSIVMRALAKFIEHHIDVISCWGCLTNVGDVSPMVGVSHQCWGCLTNVH